jgi:hypothetical protein
VALARGQETQVDAIQEDELNTHIAIIPACLDVWASPMHGRTRGTHVVAEMELRLSLARSGAGPAAAHPASSLPRYIRCQIHPHNLVHCEGEDGI